MRKTLVTSVIILAMGLSLTACGGGRTSQEAASGQAAETTTEAPAVMNEESDAWYRPVLEDDTYRQMYSYYTLADINLDGLDELFLSTTKDYFITDQDKVCLLTFDNGEVKKLKEIGGAAGEYFHVNQSDATLTYFSRLSGEEDLILYKLEAGELKETATANYYAQHHYPERDTDEEVYLMDGKETTKEEYDSFYEQYAGEAGALTYDNQLEGAAAEEQANSNTEVVDGVSIDYGESNIYSREDMDAAIALIKAEFDGWKGCEMHSISYNSDDFNNEENLKWVNDLKENKNYTQCMEFLSDFHSPVNDEDVKAWEKDQEYRDYNWVLARADGGEWELVTWGY